MVRRTWKGLLPAKAYCWRKDTLNYRSNSSLVTEYRWPFTVMTT